MNGGAILSMETSVILRSILFQLKRAKSHKEALAAITAMCSQDDIAAVNNQIQQLEKDETAEQEGK